MRAEIKRTKAEKEQEKKHRKGKGKGRGRGGKSQGRKADQVTGGAAEKEEDQAVHEPAGSNGDKEDDAAGGKTDDGFSISSVEERLKNERQENSDEDEAEANKKDEAEAKKQRRTKRKSEQQDDAKLSGGEPKEKDATGRSLCDGLDSQKIGRRRKRLRGDSGATVHAIGQMDEKGFGVELGPCR